MSRGSSVNLHSLILFGGILLGLCAAAYHYAFHCGFVYDDHHLIVNNVHIRDGVTMKGVQWAFGLKTIDYWQPLHWLSHMLDCELFGLNPAGHHGVSLLFHAANSVLLFYVFTLMTGETRKSVFIAAIFAVHPIHVDSAVWLTERKTLLSAFWGLLTVICYYHYTRTDGWKWYGAVMLCLAASLAAKPMLVTLPVLLLLLDVWPLKRIETTSSPNVRRHLGADFFSRPVLEKIPLCLLSMASILFTTISFNCLTMEWTQTVDLSLRLQNVPVAYITYIRKLFWPFDLAVHYPFPAEIPLMRCVSAGLLILLLTITAVRNYATRPYLIVGWLWFLVALLPAIGMKQAGIWGATADRHAYIPFIGIFLVLAWGITDLLPKENALMKKAAAILAAVSVMTMAAITSRHVRYYQNDLTLFTRALEVTDNNYVAHSNICVAYGERGETDLALKHCLAAIQIQPDHDIAHNNLGYLYQKTGRVDLAREHFLKAIQISPSYITAYTNIGALLRFLGKLDEAEGYLNQALHIEPDSPEALTTKGLVLMDKGALDAAIDHFRRALRSNPYQAETYNNISKAYFLKNQYREALENLKKANALMPGNPVIQGNIRNVQAIIDGDGNRIPP